MAATPVLYLAPWVDLGGSDKGTIDWFRHLDKRRFAPSLITTQPSDDRWLRHVEPHAEEVWALPDLMPGAGFPSFILGFVESRGVEVVHVMNSRLGFDLLPALAALRRPPAVVVQLHAEEQDGAGYVRYVATRFGNLVHAFSVTSEQLGRALAGYEIPWSRIHVIPTGVDAEEEFNPERVEPLALPGDGPRVLWPGRVVDQKDPMLTLEVLAALRARSVRLTLDVVGDGDLVPAVRRRARELGVAEMIAWHPPSQEMARWYASSDLLLMTSAFEGVPYVVYEALAMGLPVVAPALPGNVELMDADSGALVDPRDDVAAYADAIQALLADERARVAMGERSRARMRERFSVRKMAAAHEELYGELLARRPAPRPAAAAPPPEPEPLRLPRTPPPERSVAVIVPCFRHGLYVPECLESIRAQTLPAAQVIVVDDGSDDPETQAALDALGPDVELVRLPENRGPSAARNRALELVTASYVLPLDADDKLFPDALERLVEQLEAAGPEIGFVYPHRRYFGNRHDHVPAPDYDLYLLTVDNYCPAAALFDRRVFDAGVRYAEDIRHGHEDWDLVLALAERGVHGEPAREPTFWYRDRGFSRDDAVEHAAAFHGEMRRRHPRLYADRAALKARWSPALSIVALEGAPALAEQTCGDFEVTTALEDARGRWLLAVTDAAAPALARHNLVEQLLREFAADEALLGIVLADPPGGNGAAFARLAGDDVATATPVAVGWRRGAAAVELGLTGSLLGDLAVALQVAGPVQWRNAGFGAPAERKAPPLAPAQALRPLVTPPADATQALRDLEPPALPGLAADELPWGPPGTHVISRHVAGDGRRVVTVGRRPPPGFALEFDLGFVHRHELPGTRPLAGLGHIESNPLPLLEPLELRRDPQTGERVLVAGPHDPLHDRTEPLERLGWLDSLPIGPRQLLPGHGVWGLVGLWRSADPAAWRHDYATTPGGVCLGTLFAARAPGFVALERHGPGDLRSGLLAAPPPRPRPREAARWVGAPLRWAGRPRAWALRATGSRARHLAGGAPSHQPATLGWLRAAPAPGWSPLFAARHPALPDTFATRSELEARDLGYRVLGVLGYICDVLANRDVTTQPQEVLWGSRFGRSRRYVEGPVP